MPKSARPTPEALRAARAETPALRDRDLAESLGVSEAELLAAHLGLGALRIEASPDTLIPRLAAFGPLMALTRNDSCVIEKTGVYANYSGGAHAGLVAAGDIDLRFFPSHWAYAFAVERESTQGLQRSFQIFDAAGDAVHKIFLRPASDATPWAGVLADLRHADQTSLPEVVARDPAEPPRAKAERAAELRGDWAKMTDTHQFLRVVARLKMNRLGAYRVVGAPFARPLEPAAILRVLQAAAAGSVPMMAFVGNRGCIEIHSGPIARVVEMGPWINILDPGFDLHLRGDHIAEVWAVDKPTQRGAAVSVECFDAQGGLIAQFFGVRKAGDAAIAAWEAIIAAEPTRTGARVGAELV